MISILIIIVKAQNCSNVILFLNQRERKRKKFHPRKTKPWPPYFLLKPMNSLILVEQLQPRALREK